MRKIIAVVILIGLGIALYFYLGKINEQTIVEKSFNENELSEEVVLYYLDNDYEELINKLRQLQGLPDQITRFNALLTLIIYSAELNEEQVKLLVELQRLSYHKDVLGLNPFDVQFTRVLEELELYQAYGNDGLKIIGYKVVGPEFSVVDGQEYAFMNVLYYLSLTNVVKEGDPGEDGNLYMGYILEQNIDKLWEIKGWAPVDEFLTID